MKRRWTISDRVSDQQDLSLIVTATRIQTSTGGKLAEILACMSKVRAGKFEDSHEGESLSAEGRWSAIILSILPFTLFGVLALVAPGFYGDVWDEPIVKFFSSRRRAWLMIGNLIMFRMVRFQI